jgi:uncharacterized membrane protein
MIKKINNLLAFSILGNTVMIVARFLVANDFYYGFLLWNLFLAGIPLVISQFITRHRIKNKLVLTGMLYLWLLFLPNAPYIITDMVHLAYRAPVPFWYDMLLILLSAVNGLIMGFVSIGQVEKLLSRYQKVINPNIFRILLILAMSYGVYIGRYLRYNSWDAFIRPVELGREMFHTLHAETVGFVLVFGFINFVLYGFYRSILLFRSQVVA